MNTADLHNDIGSKMLQMKEDHDREMLAMKENHSRENLMMKEEVESLAKGRHGRRRSSASPQDMIMAVSGMSVAPTKRAHGIHMACLDHGVPAKLSQLHQFLLRVIGVQYPVSQVTIEAHSRIKLTEKNGWRAEVSRLAL